MAVLTLRAVEEASWTILLVYPIKNINFPKRFCVVSSTCILASRNQTSYPMCHAY